MQFLLPTKTDLLVVILKLSLNLRSIMILYHQLRIKKNPDTNEIERKIKKLLVDSLVQSFLTI